MTLPDLRNWDDTRAALHQAAQVIGAIRKLGAPRQPNAWHLTLQVAPRGVSSGPLAFGGELILDFAAGAVVYERAGQAPEAVPLAGHTQVSLTDALVSRLAALGQPVQPDQHELTGTVAFNLDLGTAAAYAPALNSIYATLLRFRDWLAAPTGPVVLWPHNFDSAFLVFANPERSESGLHAAFGFEPRTPDLPRPYFYAYVRPTPDGITQGSLPALARWHTQGWTGAVIAYDDIASLGDHEAALETTLQGVFTAFKPFLGL